MVDVNGGCDTRGVGRGHYGNVTMRVSFAAAAVIVFEALRGTIVDIVEVLCTGDNDC